MTRRSSIGDLDNGFAVTAAALVAVVLAAIALIVATRATRPTAADQLTACRGVQAMRTAHLIGGVDVLVPYPVTPGGGGVTNLTYIVVTDPACVQRITGKLPAGASGPFNGGMTSNHP